MSGKLGKEMISSTRNGLAFSIENKHNLSPAPGSCISCAIEKAVQAIQVSYNSFSGGVLDLGILNNKTMMIH